MFKTLTFAALSFIALADDRSSAKLSDLKKKGGKGDKKDDHKPEVCKRTCEAPYLLDAVTCKCNGLLSVDPICATDFTADKTACECTNAADALLTYAMSCKYGFALNTTTCQCDAPPICDV